MKRQRAKIESKRGPATFLFYWKDYFENTRRHGFISRFRWYSHSPHRVLDKIQKGDRVWAMALIERGKYGLVAKFVVSRAWQEKTSPRKGEWTHSLDVSESQSICFKPERQHKFEKLIRSLRFKPKAKHLGKAFQGVHSLRELEPNDDRLLVKHARSLTLQNPPSKESLDKELTKINKGSPEWREAVREIAIRDSRNVKLLKKELKGQCQICGKKPFGGDFDKIVQAHHIKWLSQGGHDVKENMILLCPNHHVAIHAVNGQFDPKRFGFKFSRGFFPIKIAHHLRKQTSKSKTSSE